MSFLNKALAWINGTDWAATVGWVSSITALAASVMDFLLPMVDLPDQVVPAYLLIAATAGATSRYGKLVEQELATDHDGDGVPLSQDRDEQLVLLRSGLKWALYEARLDRDGDGVPTFRDHEDAKEFFLGLIESDPPQPNPSTDDDG